MAARMVHHPRHSSEKSFVSDNTLDEQALLDEFCRDFLPLNQDVKDLNMSSISSVSNSTVQSKSTAVSIGVRDGTKDLVLKWSTKEELIAILNEYSAILHGKVADDEQAILDKTNALLQTLTGLPMRLKERISDGWNGLNELNSAPAAADSNAASKPSNADQNTKTTGDLLLDLKWKARSRIVETLTTNQSFAIFNCRYISSESKRGLIQKNNELIQMLLGLRVRLVEKEKIGYLFAEEAPEKKDDKGEHGAYEVHTMN